MPPKNSIQQDVEVAQSRLERGIHNPTLKPVIRVDVVPSTVAVVLAAACFGARNREYIPQGAPCDAYWEMEQLADDVLGEEAVTEAIHGGGIGQVGRALVRHFEAKWGVSHG